MREGSIDYRKAQLIAEAIRVLTDDQARQVEAQVLAAAAGQTTGQLRAAVARAVLAADPEAATRRREEAQKDPRVRRWQEDAGTAALAGFGLPPADVLEADQRLTTRALALGEAGLPGSLEDLRARAYLDTLLGQDSAPPTDPGRGCLPAGTGPDDRRPLSANRRSAPNQSLRLPAPVPRMLPQISSGICQCSHTPPPPPLR